MRMLVAMVLVLGILVLAALTVFRPSIADVRYSATVSVGGAQRVEVRGPMKPAVIVCSPSGACEEYMGERVASGRAPGCPAGGEGAREGQGDGLKRNRETHRDS